MRKSAAQLIPRQFHQTDHFKGLQLTDAPRDLRDGYVTQADGLLLDAGRLTTRPGLRGQWTSPLGAPVYLLLEYVKADGTLATLLTSGGKLYKWTKGATSATEILNGGVSFSLNSANARAAFLRDYAYIVDGSGPLIRTDLTTGASVTGLSVPTAAPSAALTGQLLAQLNLAASWGGDGSAPAANLLPNYTGNFGASQFPNATTANGWKSSSDANLNGALLNLDNVGEEVHLDDGAGVTVKLNPEFTGNPGLYATRLRVTGSVKIDAVGTNNNRVSLKVTAYSDTSGTAGASTQTYAIPVPSTNAQTTVDHTFDFSAYVGDILSWGVQLINTAGTNGPAHFWVNQFQAFPVGVSVSFANGSPGVQVTITESGSADGVLDVAGVALTATLPAALGSDPGNVLTLALANADKYTGLAFHVDAQLSGTAAWTSLGTLTLTSDQSKGYVDVSSLSATDRAAIVKIRLTFINDVTNTDTSAALGIGPLIGGGNLTVARTYDWLYTEIDDEGSLTLAAFIESSGSPHSNQVVALADAATGLVTLPSAPLNASSTHYKLWRTGGVYPDALPRLVATEQWGVSDFDGSATGNPYVNWNAGTHVLKDNTPDSWLLYADTVETGHEGPPTGAQAIAAHQNRLALAVGPDLYLSWEVDANNQAALYFNRLNDPADPMNSVKGGVFGTQTRIPINALVSYGTSSDNYNVNFGTTLLLFKDAPGETSVLFGTDPTNFRMVGYLVKTGVGLSAPRCALVVENSVWFLGANGWDKFNGNAVTPESLPVERVLSPSAYGGAALNAAAVKASSAVYHGRRLYHFSPFVAGDSANAGAYVWDSRGDGWTRLPGLAVTSAVSSGSVTGDLMLGGADGQLYLLDPSAYSDKATPGASAAPVSWALAGRGFGQEGGGEAWFAAKQATRLYAVVEARESTTVTPGVRLESRDWAGTAFTLTGTPSVPVSNAVRVKPPQDTRGRFLEVTLSGTATQKLTIAALGLETATRSLK